jgi:hypothetical protein
MSGRRQGAGSDEEGRTVCYIEGLCDIEGASK